MASNLPTFREEEERQRRERIKRETERRIQDLATRGQPGAGEVRLFQRKAERAVQQGEREAIAGAVGREREEAAAILAALDQVEGKPGASQGILEALEQTVAQGDVASAAAITDGVIQRMRLLGDSLPPGAAERFAEIAATSMQSGIGRMPTMTGLGGAAATGEQTVTRGILPLGPAGGVPTLSPNEASAQGMPVGDDLRTRAASGQQVFVGRGSDEAFPERVARIGESRGLVGPPAPTPSTAPVVAEARPKSILPIGGSPASSEPEFRPFGPPRPSGLVTPQERRAVGFEPELAATGRAIGATLRGGIFSEGAPLEAVPGELGRPPITTPSPLVPPGVEAAARGPAEGAARAGAMDLGSVAEQAESLARRLFQQGLSVGEVVEFIRQRFPEIARAEGGTGSIVGGAR